MAPPLEILYSKSAAGHVNKYQWGYNCGMRKITRGWKTILWLVGRSEGDLGGGLLHRGEDVSVDYNRLIARQARGFQPKGTTCANALRHKRAWYAHITLSISISCNAGHVWAVIEKSLVWWQRARVDHQRPVILAKELPTCSKEFSEVLSRQRLSMYRIQSPRHQRACRFSVANLAPWMGGHLCLTSMANCVYVLLKSAGQ